MAGPVAAVTDASFPQFTAQGLVLVDFSADWCPPCRRMDPIVDELARETPGVAFGRLDVDASRATAARNGVQSMPTFVLYRDGRPVDRVVGAVPKQRLAAVLARHRSLPPNP